MVLGKPIKKTLYNKGNKMKKFLLLTILLMVTVAMMSPATNAQSEDPEGGPVAFVAMLSGFIDNNYETTKFGGGGKVGGIVSLDKSKGLFARVVYNKFNVNVDSVQASQSLDVAGMLVWDFGRRWDFYVLAGGSSKISGPSLGTDWSGGFGGSKVIWTQDSEPNLMYPAIAKLFVELNLNDGDPETIGNYAQINIGFTISPPVWKSRL